MSVSERLEEALKTLRSRLGLRCSLEPWEFYAYVSSGSVHLNGYTADEVLEDKLLLLLVALEVCFAKEMDKNLRGHIFIMEHPWIYYARLRALEQLSRYAEEEGLSKRWCELLELLLEDPWTPGEVRARATLLHRDHCTRQTVGRD